MLGPLFRKSVAWASGGASASVACAGRHAGTTRGVTKTCERLTASRFTTLATASWHTTGVSGP